MPEQDHPTIAVVDAFSSGVHLARALCRLGAKVVHVRSAERLDPYYEATFRPELISLDLGFAPMTHQLRTLRALRVRRVLPGTESGVALAEKLAAHLDVPTNLDRLARARRDKHAMVRALEIAEVPAPRSTAVSSTHEAEQWCARAGLNDAVVKPLGSAGSDNVRVCHGATEIRSAVARVLGSVDLFGRRNDAALVQEYLDGPEFYINAVSSTGTHSPVEIWRYTKSDGPDGSRLFDYEEPVHPNDAIWHDLWSYSVRALDALGFRNGPSHLEVIMPDSQPLLIDPAARLGGGVLPETNERLAGTSHALETATAAIDLHQRALPAVYPETTRYVSLVNHRAGTAKFDWLTEFQQLPTSTAVHTTLEADVPVPVTTDLLSSPGFLYLHGPREAVLADYATIRKREAEGCYTAASPVSR